MRVLPLLAFALVAVTGSPLSAQPALRATAVAGGAADASGGDLRLRATAGQAAVGRVARRQVAVQQGFWPTASVRRTRLGVEILLASGPVVVEAGGKFRYVARFTAPAGAPGQFDYWAVDAAPDGTTQTVLGPVTLLVTPPAVTDVGITQELPVSAPPGSHTYTLLAGAAWPAAETRASIPVMVRLPPSLPADAALASSEAPAHARGGAAPMARTDLRMAARVGAPWLAYTDNGVILAAGTVLDLRADSADSAVAAKDGPDTMVPEDAPSVVADLPTVVTLGAPHPNPTRTSSTVRFGLPAAGPVRLTVYDALGRRVADLADGVLGAGWHTTSVSTDGLAGGVYLIRLEAGDQSAIRRLTVVR